MTSADLDSYKAKAEAKLAGSSARMETLEQTDCLPKSYFESVWQAFADPVKFWRKW